MKNKNLEKIFNTLGIIFAVVAILAAAGIFIAIFFPVLVLIVVTVICFQVARHFSVRN